MDPFEVVYHLSHSPWWMGWPMVVGGAFGLGVIIGRWIG